ncbi:MAG TPA: ribosome biogenesis GTPase Der [Patescibacteria group bacterium]|nr:ribosome biogenesis GTPase Der [Patescibacteria group bacterium]
MSSKVPIVAIVGRANVGKSSLFNAIIGHREAIVASEPGTTRDSIMARASYLDRDFWIIDTAGIKDAEDDFEFTIQEQITQAADSADVIIVVVEANVMVTEEDRRVAKLALKSKKPVMLIVNKIDKNSKANLNDYLKLGIKPVLATSTTQQRGIEEALAEIVKDLPVARIIEDDNRIHVAILGRPNVGKSLLFNALAKKQQAIVADRAGTTRDINRAVVRFNNREIELLDTAGIRRSGKIEVGVEKFSVIRSLSAIEQADVCLLLIDTNEIGVQLDQKIAGIVKEAGKGLILTVSKWDIAQDKDAYTRDSLAPVLKSEFEFVPWAPLIFTSSITGQNVTKLFELVLHIVENRTKKIGTSELNRWLRAAVDAHPPAGLKNSYPRLNYITQTDEATPTFKVFGSHTKLLHWSYKRYLDKQMRLSFGYEGTPLKLYFSEKHEYQPNAPKPRGR